MLHFKLRKIVYHSFNSFRNRIETQRSVVFMFKRFHVCILELRLFKASTQLTQAKSIFAIFQAANSKSFVPQPAARQWFLRRNLSNKAPKTEKNCEQLKFISLSAPSSSCFSFLCVFCGGHSKQCPKKHPYNLPSTQPPVKNCPPELVCW